MILLHNIKFDTTLTTPANRDKLLERGSFLTRFSSEIESDPVGEYPRAAKCLESLGIDPSTVTDEDFSSLR